MTKKRQKSERQKAIIKTDRNCSLYVRLSHADQNGYCHCYTCDKRLHRKKIQCGHCIGRGYIMVRYDLDNVRPQCWGCNAKHMGNGKTIEFKAHLIDEIGEERVRAVEEKALAEVRDPIRNTLSAPEILEINEHFKELLIPFKHLIT